MTWVEYSLSYQLLNNTKYNTFRSQVVLFKIRIQHLGSRPSDAVCLIRVAGQRPLPGAPVQWDAVSHDGSALA